MSNSANGNPVGAACFSVTATASPGVMPRLLELFAKRGLVPSVWHSRVNDSTLSVEIQMAEMPAALAEYIAACLRQIYMVDRVLLSSRRADAADRDDSAIALGGNDR